MNEQGGINGWSAGLNSVLAASVAVIHKGESAILWHVATWTIVLVAAVHLTRAGIAIARHFNRRDGTQ